MAVAGGGSPSTLANIRNGELRTTMSTNVPNGIICTDMAIAADLLRKEPSTTVLISFGPDGGNVPRLREYLVRSGHVTKW